MAPGVMLALLLSLSWAAPSYFINGPYEVPFGVDQTWSVSEWPSLCSATAPVTRVTGPRGEIVPSTLGPCIERGLRRLTFRSCREGMHVVAVLNVDGDQIAALNVVSLPQVQRVVEVAGPAERVVFEFDGAIPQSHD